MKTTNRLILATAALFVLGWTTACQSGAEPKSATVNQPAAKTEVSTIQPDAPKTADEKAPAGSMATPTEAYKTAYAARQKKDVAGLKQTFSKDALEFFTVIAEAEKKTVEDELKQLVDKPQAATAETRNEKINGDTATLEYLDEKGGWKTMDFVKEGVEWKLTIPKAQPGEVEIINKKP